VIALSKYKKNLTLFIITLASMFLGFIRESFIVYKLGGGWEADSFIFALNLPAVIFTSLGGLITTTFMPLYTDARINNSVKTANKFASKVLKNVVLICLSIVVLFEVFPQILVSILAPGFYGETYKNVIMFTRIVLPSIIFLGVAYTFAGVVQSYKKILAVSAMQIPTHIIIILSLVVIYPMFGIEAAVLMIIIAMFSQALFMYINAKKVSFVYHKRTTGTSRYTKRLLRMIGPMSIGVMTYQINMIVNSRLASRLGAGNITAINLANKINMASYSALGFLVVLFLYPVLSEYAAKKDFENIIKALEKGILLIVFLMLPVTVVICFFSKDIVSILFGYGKFKRENIELTSGILIYYSLGILFLGIKDMLNRVFYSLKDTEISMINGIVTIIVNLALSLILMKVIGASGLALAYTISVVVSVILLFKSLKNFNMKINYSHFLVEITKIIVSSGVMVLFLYLQGVLFNFNLTSKLEILLKIGGVTVISSTIYLSMLYLLRFEYLSSIINSKINKFK